MTGLLPHLDEGVAALAGRELVHLLLGGGRRTDALAGKLLARGLSPLRRLREVDLVREHGLAHHRAARLVAGVELGRRVLFAAPEVRPRLVNTAALSARLWPHLAHLAHEEFWVLLLSAQLEELLAVRVSAGGLSQCSVTPREAFAPALIHRAPAVVFAHNHPSGDPTPSSEDLRLQLHLEEVAHALSLHLVDHLVVGEQGVHSARFGRHPPPPPPA